MTQDTEDVVAELRQIAELILDGVTLGAGTLGVGRANAARKAADLIQSLSDRIDVLEAKAVSYDHAHEDAVEMGYPSLTEALEHLDELRTAKEEHGQNG